MAAAQKISSAPKAAAKPTAAAPAAKAADAEAPAAKHTAPPPSKSASTLSEAAKLGTKMMRGAKLLNDMRNDDVAIATTPKDVVWQQDKVTLYRYRPLAPQKIRIPVLICYGLVGRWTMADLQDDRSLVQNLLKLGIDLYVVDWGNPSRADRFLRMDDYVDMYLDECVEEMCRLADVDRVNLLGICEGGVFATCYAALYPEKLQSLILAVTPIDFHGDTVDARLGHGFINLWTRSIDPAEVDRMIEVHGNLPGEFMGAVFSLMTPMRTMLKYNLDILEVVDDPKKLMNFLRMEKWIADRPDHPGEAAKQWLKDLYQQNKLIRNELELSGRKVDLHNITMPVLNIYAIDDHIIPPATSKALGREVGTKDYSELALPAGHIGLFVGGRSQKLLGPGIVDWLGKRE